VEHTQKFWQFKYALHCIKDWCELHVCLTINLLCLCWWIMQVFLDMTLCWWVTC
jgi:hypothetical protein